MFLEQDKMSDSTINGKHHNSLEYVILHWKVRRGKLNKGQRAAGVKNVAKIIPYRED